MSNAGNIKPGNPGITGRAAGNQTIDDATIVGDQSVLDGVRTLTFDAQAGDIDIVLPNAEGYAGSDITIDFVVAASGNTGTVKAASGNTINGLATLSLTADSVLKLIPFGTNWRTLLSA
jgi:hypothetical protein